MSARRLLAIAGLSCACDPLLADPRLPTPQAAWRAPEAGALTSRAAPVAMAGEVLDCAGLSDVTWTIDDRPMRTPLELGPGATWRADVPVAEIVAAVGLDALAAPVPRPGTWRVQATCDDFGARVETPPRAVLVSPFEAVADAGAPVEALLVSAVGDDRPAVLALTSGDLRRMDGDRDCADDAPAAAPLSSCWQPGAARPSGAGPLHRMDGLLALGVRCDDFDGGRLCPPGFAAGLVFLDDKFDAALRVPTPPGCRFETAQVDLQTLYVLSVCDGAEDTAVERFDVVDGVGGPRITRALAGPLPGRPLGLAAARDDGSVRGYGRRADGQVERWVLSAAGADSEAVAVPVAAVPRAVAVGTDGDLLVTVDTAEGVEIRRFRPDAAAPASVWRFDRDDVFGQMFGAEAWARSADALWALPAGGPPIPVDLGPGTRWQIVAADPGVLLVMGGPALGVGPARVLHADPAGAVREVLPALGLALRARLVRARDRVYGALGPYPFTLRASPTSPPPP